jgi:hypothetical protein
VNDVDPVVAAGVVDGVRGGVPLRVAVDARRDAVVEGEGVPGEPPAGGQAGGDPFEGPAPLGPGG